jgi:hypothetical protein
LGSSENNSSKYLLKINQLQGGDKKIVLFFFVLPILTIYLCDPFLVTQTIFGNGRRDGPAV